MLTSIPSVVHYDVEVTDDPLVSRTPLARLTENSKVTCLGTMGEWTYIEAEADEEWLRGFVPSACLYETVTELSEARQAMRRADMVCAACVYTQVPYCTTCILLMALIS